MAFTMDFQESCLWVHLLNGTGSGSEGRLSVLILKVKISKNDLGNFLKYLLSTTVWSHEYKFIGDVSDIRTLTWLMFYCQFHSLFPSPPEDDSYKITIPFNDLIE